MNILENATELEVVAHTFKPALGRQKQANLFEFEASLVYKSEFKDSQDCYTEKPCLEKTKQRMASDVAIFLLDLYRREEDTSPQGVVVRMKLPTCPPQGSDGST